MGVVRGRHATQGRHYADGKRTKPYLLVASPPCTVFSALQNLSRDKREAAEVQAELDAGIRHLAFAVFLCLKQASEGRKFVFEHPVSASSWQLALVNKLLDVDNAERVNFDICKVGMTIAVQGAVLPVKKRTSVVTNSSRLTRALRQCQWPGASRPCKHDGRPDKTVRGLPGHVLRAGVPRGPVGEN